MLELGWEDGGEMKVGVARSQRGSEEGRIRAVCFLTSIKSLVQLSTLVEPDR